MTEAARPPLTTLLSWVWVAFTIEADNTVEAAAPERVSRLFRISMAMWANGLRGIDEAGTPVSDLHERVRARCNIGGLERWGWIAVGDTAVRRDGFGSGRGIKGDTVLRPTRAGVYAKRVWPAAVAEVEDRWRARFGEETVDDLATALAPFDDELPSALPEVHSSNGFRTTVVDTGTPDERVPGVAARLARVLTGLTLRFEDGGEVALPLVANVMRPLADEVPARDLAARAGISKEAVAMGRGVLTRHKLAGDGLGARLTSKGRRCVDDYWSRSESIDDDDVRAALAPILAQPGTIGEGLIPPIGCWRASKPYLAQTRRLVADPLGSLPWHPMVLHRGGWPDGC